MYIIVGLGNPGREYAETRHNAGFRTVDAFIDEFHIDGPQVKFRAMLGKGTVGAEKVLCVKPLTYMNLSGEAVRAVCDFYKIDPAKELIVICDDVALPAGHLRIRKKGSDGGHNGLKSIIRHLGTQEFTRIRIGVGGKPEGWDLADHVLAKLNGEDKTAIEEAEKAAAQAAAAVITDGPDFAMNRFNTAKEKKPPKAAKPEAAHREDPESECNVDPGSERGASPVSGHCVDPVSECGADPGSERGADHV